MNTSALNTVYNHYLPMYVKKGTSAYDTHKKSELRGIYNSIVKLNKESPLYLIKQNKENQEYAVSIKEGARDLRNTIASLGGLDQDAMLSKKTAYSSNEEIAVAKYIGDGQETEEVPSFEIEVSALASEQVNTGNFLPSSDKFLSPGTYSFDVGVHNLNYEFQFNVNPDDTNRDVQDRLTRLINNSNVGITASVLEDADQNSSLRLTSQNTGTTNGSGLLFTVSDDQTSKTSGSVAFLGIGIPTRLASDSSFSLNGVERHTASNQFTVEKMYEITLQGISPTEGQTSTIGLKTDTESLTENISQLASGYNEFLRAASEFTQTQQRAGSLVSELKGISTDYKNSLDSIGLTFGENGYIEVNETHLKEAAESDDAQELLSTVKDFTASLYRKTNQVSINPMNYVDKTIVAYKNPGKNFASPYVTSSYSGMMFNSYC